MIRRAAVLLTLSMLASTAWAQAPCTENSPSGQYNCNVFASQNQTATPGNLLLVLENSSSATPYTQCTATESGVASVDCFAIVDSDNSTGENWTFLHGTNRTVLGPTTLTIDADNTGSEPVNGAGLYIEGGSGLDATLLYNSTLDQIAANYALSAPAFFAQAISSTPAYGGAFRMEEAVTIDSATNNFYGGRFTSTFTYEQNGILTSYGWHAAPTLTNPSTEARAFGSYIGFDDAAGHSYNATTGAVSLTAHRGFYSHPSFARAAGANTDTITAATGFEWAPTVGSNVTTTTARGVWIRSPAVSGTITTNLGIDIDALGGTTQIGLRNADTTVWTPTTQAIAAAATTIASDTTIKAFSTATGDTIISNTPIIADGVGDGQFITYLNVDATDTDCVVLKDQGTLGSSNLRLATRRFKMCPRDVLALTYNSTVGDWVELYRKKRITAPSVTSCGSGASLTAGSTDFAGEVTFGTGTVTACTIGFGEAKDTDKPFCVFSWGSTPTAAKVQATTSTTGILFLLDVSSPSAHFYYHCVDT